MQAHIHTNKSLPGVCHIFNPSVEEVVVGSVFKASRDCVVRPSFKNKQTETPETLKLISAVKLMTVVNFHASLICPFVFGFLSFFIFSVVYITLIFLSQKLWVFMTGFLPTF